MLAFENQTNISIATEAAENDALAVAACEPAASETAASVPASGQDVGWQEQFSLIRTLHFRGAVLTAPPKPSGSAIAHRAVRSRGRA